MASRQYNTSDDRNVLGHKPYFSHWIRSSRSCSATGSSDEDDSGTPSTNQHAYPERGAKCHGISTSTWTASWMPYTFTHLFLAVLSLAALALCLVTFLLWWKSSTNYGLGPDDGSSALLFGWRYTPTLLAVIYVQMTTVLFEDVKRTEPFARLARAEGAEASSSICSTPGAWWNTLYDGFAKKKNGSRSWTLICVSIVNIVGFLAISPLSSAYLFSDDVVVPKVTDFRRLTPMSGSPLPIDADRATNFRAIANLLQNVSTSPWITDEYTILPFWPANIQTAPITSLPSDSSQKWEAETTMFKSELTCTEMTLERQSSPSPLYSKNGIEYGALPSESFIWSSSDGCKYGLSVDKYLFENGGGSWSDVSTFYFAYDALFDDGRASLSTNHTAECDGKELLFVTEPWKLEKPVYSAQLCDTKYYMANITTSIALTGDEPDVTFSKAEFEQKKAPIPSIILNTTQFRELIFDPSWPTYAISVIWSQTAMMGGPSFLLGALYDYNLTALVADPAWVASAGKAHQRYFGEVLQAALAHPGASVQTAMKGHVREIETRVLVEAGVAIALGILFGISFILIIIVWWCSRSQRRPLNLKEDPASTLGVACLVAHNVRTQASFKVFRQPSQKELREKLDGARYFTDENGLSRLKTDDTNIHSSVQSENGTPPWLRLPALLGLVIVLVAVVIGIAVLYYFAETAGLYEKAFVYEVKLSFLSNGISSVAPFSMIPTIIATGTGLWWSVLDENFRRLQPFVAMSRHNPPFSRGVGLSYQSSFWLWACVKAALNKHWLLSLLTLGTSLSPVFTTAMSALFDRAPGVISQPISLNRSIEIRAIPHVFETAQSWYPGSSNDYTANVLAGLFTNLSTHWMYTAVVELTLNGSQPAWSKDGWSFVPIDMTNLQNVDLPQGIDNSDPAVDGSQSNVSFTTPALRGRLECSQYPRGSLTNLSLWLTPKDLSNHTYWNVSTIPRGLEGGYQLGTQGLYSYSPSVIMPYGNYHNMSYCPGCTTVFVNPSGLKCCTNSSSDTWDGSVSIGYWSPQTNPAAWTTRNWGRNFTAKWIYGNAVSGIKNNIGPANMIQDNVDMLFPSVPSVTMLNCRPLVESTDADVTVNPHNGEIQTFEIKATPQELPGPFSDNFLPHNKTHFSREDALIYYNITVSYGRLFMAAMLTAADTLHIGGAKHTSGYTYEDLIDNTYNIRDELNGLNMDFMSYAMYSMAGKDPTALLDPTTYTTLAQKTFTTFFQHFVSNNISLETGGWGYQKINASLPATLGPIIELKNGYLPGPTASKYQDVMHPISHTNRTASATITQRVELLQMNAIAVWLSLSILAWLIATMAVVAVLQRRYFGSLVRNVECLGDMLVLIAGSANLLQLVRDIQAGRLVSGDYEHLNTRLGWFVDRDGELRWGVEMEESFERRPGVRWVRAPDFGKKGGSRTRDFEDEESW